MPKVVEKKTNFPFKNINVSNVGFPRHAFCAYVPITITLIVFSQN